MRSRLSYYSVLLLVGLAIFSASIFVMNPFNSAPVTTPLTTKGVATPSAANGSTPPVSNGSAPFSQGGNGLQPGGTFDGTHHHHLTGFSDDDGTAGNSTTTTTTTGTVYSQRE